MSNVSENDNCEQPAYGVWKEYPKQIPCVEKYYLVTIDGDYGDFMMDIAAWFLDKWYGRTSGECTNKVQAFCEIPHAYRKDE